VTGDCPQTPRKQLPAENCNLAKWRSARS
jgi:hypothetical protein